MTFWGPCCQVKADMSTCWLSARFWCHRQPGLVDDVRIHVYDVMRMMLNPTLIPYSNDVGCSSIGKRTTQSLSKRISNCRLFQITHNQIIWLAQQWQLSTYFTREIWPVNKFCITLCIRFALCQCLFNSTNCQWDAMIFWKKSNLQIQTHNIPHWVKPVMDI